MNEQLILFKKIQEYSDFEPGNDPYGEHDFGMIEHNGMKIYFKIDYRNKDLTEGSSNPADVHETSRVMTIMLASEY